MQLMDPSLLPPQLSEKPSFFSLFPPSDQRKPFLRDIPLPALLPFGVVIGLPFFLLNDHFGRPPCSDFANPLFEINFSPFRTRAIPFPPLSFNRKDFPPFLAKDGVCPLYNRVPLLSRHPRSRRRRRAVCMFRRFCLPFPKERNVGDPFSTHPLSISLRGSSLQWIPPFSESKRSKSCLGLPFPFPIPFPTTKTTPPPPQKGSDPLFFLPKRQFSFVPPVPRILLLPPFGIRKYMTPFLFSEVFLPFPSAPSPPD